MKGSGKVAEKMKHFLVKMKYLHECHIPKKFAQIIEGSVSKSIKLEGSSGITRHVKMVKSKDTFILKSGWNDFVTANKIDKNDSLVFSYEGNSTFKVLIFDPSGCEKDDSMRVGDVPHREVKTEAISISSGSDTDTESTNEVSSPSARGDTVEDLSESDEGNIPVRKTAKQKCPKKKFSSYIVPQKTYLTRAQEEIADKMARQAQKGSYLFMKILTSTNCGDQRSCVLNLPTGFASKVLRSKKQVITLLPANLDKSKGCNAKYNKRTNMRCISWRKFMQKNGLKEGDLCLFELRKQEMQGNLVLTMLVHCEATEKSTKKSVGFGSASRGEGKKKIISPSSGRDTNSHSEIPSRARVLKRKRKESNDSDEGTHKTSRPYIIPFGTRLTNAQEDKAERMSQKTQKDSELFVKILTAGNTRHGGNFSLNLPFGFASEVLRTKKRIITLVRADVEKRSKEYTANYRKNRSVRCIGKGWPEFVSANGLKEGQFCLFELRKERKQGKLVLTMVVHFDRK